MSDPEPPSVGPKVEEATSVLQEEIPKLIDAIAEVNFSIRKAHPDADPGKNFAWEHFFTVHCGILPGDARKYEEALIAHRLDPLDTFGESIGLIIEYARIPIGDKLKITKTVDGKEKDLERRAEAMEDAKKSLGLEKYKDFDARMILERAPGESEYAIECGIELFEEGMEEMKRMMNVEMIKNPECVKHYEAGASLGRMMNNPSLKFLQAFGYETFEYTKDKAMSSTVTPSRPTSSDPLAGDLLLGNVASSTSVSGNAPDQMYV